LREEFFYFINSIVRDEKPSVIAPEESMAAVEACLAATGQIVTLNK